MTDAPNRGSKKCGTCALYTDMQEAWAAGCKLDACECRAQNKTFGIALCPNYKGETFIDHSNHRDLGGPITGYCEWKCPPVLRRVLWGEHNGNRFVNRDASWCHCWEPAAPSVTIDDRKHIELKPAALIGR